MASMMETIVVNVDKSMGERDRSNSNLNSVLFSSRRTNVSKILLKEMYMRYFLNEKERQAVKDGFIYVHDMDNRLIGTHNCCTSKLENVMNDGFWINGYFCKEPKNITNAVGVLGDITITSASAQYGGFTVADMDITLAPYCKKTFEYWCDELDNMKVPKDLIAELAKKQTLKELKDALQGFEFQINTRESSRGDYCFISVSIGRGSSFWEKEVSKMVLEVRREGHGDKIKQIVVFPKIIMVVDEKRLDDEVLDLAILTSSKALYPDYINSTKCSPMGCRSFLNDYILEDGTNMNHSRGNVGVVTLNLPMIFQEARVEGLSFAELVTYYTNMALDIHDKTYKHIGKQLAGSNPLMFTQGGFYGGNL
ncbi:MAG: anaerobic ribonucleoside-triphosphate reductase, partial [Cetobacterium sp.]